MKKKLYIVATFIAVLGVSIVLLLDDSKKALTDLQAPSDPPVEKTDNSGHGSQDQNVSKNTTQKIKEQKFDYVKKLSLAELKLYMNQTKYSRLYMKALTEKVGNGAISETVSIQFQRLFYRNFMKRISAHACISKMNQTKIRSFADLTLNLSVKIVKDGRTFEGFERAYLKGLSKLFYQDWIRTQSLDPSTEKARTSYLNFMRSCNIHAGLELTQIASRSGIKSVNH